MATHRDRTLTGMINEQRSRAANATDRRTYLRCINRYAVLLWLRDCAEYIARDQERDAKTDRDGG